MIWRGGVVRTANWALFMATLCLVLLLPATGHAQSDSGFEQESKLISIINAVRVERNLEPLHFEPRLGQIAAAMAQAIYQGQKLDRLGDGLEQMLRQKGYPHMLYGGRYATTGDSASKMVADWLKDGGRDSILVNRDAAEIGVAFMSSEGTAVENMPPSIWAVVIANPARPAEAGWRRSVLQLVNQFRSQHDLPPLYSNPFLDRAAMAMAKDMLARDFFSHINPSGEGPGERATLAGYRWSRVLENIAVGQPTPRDVVNAWVASKDGHREAMLDRFVTELGIGYAFTPFDPGRIGGLHYWAMTLGTPLNP